MLPRLGIPIWVKIVTICFCLLLLLGLAASGVYGYRKGRIASQQQNELSLQELRQQMDDGIREGNLEIALWAGEQLEGWGMLDPLRQEQIQELRKRQQETEGSTERPAPTPPVLSTPGIQHELWTSAETAFEAGDWTQSIQDLTDLRAVDNKYVTVGYLQLLEQAHVFLARDLIVQDQHEEAMMQLRVALALQQSEYVQAEIEAAHLMTESLSFWGVDWEVVISALQAVYTYDPTYLGIKDRLIRALQLYHDRVAAQKEYCSGYLFLSSLGSLVEEMDMTFVQQDLQKQCQAATS